ncbi:MAG TPA: hypothetical protein VF005_05600, partial [Acidimicrobiales bacterium]
ARRGAGGGAVNEDRARDVFEHLQTAALEMIAAARAALDVAEELVKEAPSAAGAFGDMAEAGRRATRQDSHRVQRIDVS